MFRFAKTVLLLVILGFLFVNYSGETIKFKDSVVMSFKLIDQDKIKDTLLDLKEEVLSTPPPLEVKKSDSKEILVSLDVSKIIDETNLQRSSNKLGILSASELLSKAALDKAKDMLKKGYFAHESPEGDGPGEVVSRSGYKFLSVGENLALGHFRSESDLVKAWMDSPPHRENILSEKWKDIGVGVVKGIYKGEEVIFAVQEFGLPESLCEKPSDTDKLEIEKGFKELGEFYELIERTREDVQSKGKNNKSAIEEFNSLVRTYNDVLKGLQTKSEQYNDLVENFNDCAKDLGI